MLFKLFSLIKISQVYFNLIGEFYKLFLIISGYVLPFELL